MTFYTDELALGYKEKCLNLPVYTTFATSEEECISSEELEGFSVIDPNERLPFGEYILKNVAREGDTWPNICTYYKE